MLVILTLVYRQHWRTILLYSLLPLILTLAPYVKNYAIFGIFDVAAGSFGLAIRAPTYEYRSAEVLLNEIEKGQLSPLVLCYKQILQPVIYNGQIYSSENCYKHIIPEFAQSEAKSILDKKPYLAYPAILQAQNTPGFRDNVIPNNLAGLVIARQMDKDAKSYLFHHPKEYKDSVLNNILQLFRTNTTYHFLIANNWRNFPLWFGSRIFSFDFLKFNSPADVKKYGPFDNAYQSYRDGCCAFNPCVVWRIPGVAGSIITRWLISFPVLVGHDPCILALLEIIDLVVYVYYPLLDSCDMGEFIETISER